MPRGELTRQGVAGPRVPSRTFPPAGVCRRPPGRTTKDAALVQDPRAAEAEDQLQPCWWRRGHAGDGVAPEDGRWCEEDQLVQPERRDRRPVSCRASGLCRPGAGGWGGWGVPGPRLPEGAPPASSAAAGSQPPGLPTAGPGPPQTGRRPTRDPGNKAVNTDAGRAGSFWDFYFFKIIHTNGYSHKHDFNQNIASLPHQQDGSARRARGPGPRGRGARSARLAAPPSFGTRGFMPKLGKTAWVLLF